MCKHCQRLVEDAEDAPVVHVFFELLARKTTRKIRADGYTNTVTADDLDISVNVTGMTLGPDPLDAARIRMLRLIEEFGGDR
jgi:hypothetical protein